MSSASRRLLEKSRQFLPIQGFYFDRPLVLLQSDDWGRAGLRDQEGWDLLHSAGVTLGENPYDFYTLETAEDLRALQEVLRKHHDSSGRHACLEMNFVLFNLDFARMRADEFRQIHLLPLVEGLPEGWKRPDLLAGYREGIEEGVFWPALHGTTHFCRPAVERHLVADDDRADELRIFWQAGTSYIYWRTPWIGYEYCDPGKPDDERFLASELQKQLIGSAVGAFAKVFSALPRSACAPGYRANENTHRAWAEHGIRCAQNGPGAFVPPHFDRHRVLQLTRTVEFEPATDPDFSVETCLREANACFERGLPAIVSIHSINFHSTVKNFRQRTIEALDEFLEALESEHKDLLYLNDQQLYDMVASAGGRTPHGSCVRQTRFTKAGVEARSKVQP